MPFAITQQEFIPIPLLEEASLHAPYSLPTPTTQSLLPIPHKPGTNAGSQGLIYPRTGAPKRKTPAANPFCWSHFWVNQHESEGGMISGSPPLGRLEIPSYWDCEFQERNALPSPSGPWLWAAHWLMLTRPSPQSQRAGCGRARQTPNAPAACQGVPRRGTSAPYVCLFKPSAWLHETAPRMSVTEHEAETY